VKQNHIILSVGSKGSGKTWLSRRVGDMLEDEPVSFVHLEMSELLRDVHSTVSVMRGGEVLHQQEGGALVTNSITQPCFLNALREVFKSNFSEQQRVIFVSGFPRDLDQAYIVASLAAARHVGGPMVSIFWRDRPEEVCRESLGNGDRGDRADDRNADAVDTAFRIYRDETLPAIHFLVNDCSIPTLRFSGDIGDREISQISQILLP
jgi:adenylate kinase family enzyme